MTQVTPIQGKPKKRATPKVSLIRLEPVLQIVQAAIWSGRVLAESPVSLCLVAESQSAKSQCLLYYSDTKTLKLFTDITAKGLMAEIRGIETRQLRHIVLLDLHMIVSHNRYTTDRALLTLGGLMEEGLGTVADAGGTLHLDGLPKIGVLMATTPDYYRSRRGHWRKTGFLSRFVSVCYTYSDSTRDTIHKAVRDHLELPDPLNLELPEEGQAVEIADKHANTVMHIATTWGSENNDPGFRYHKQLRRILKACALIDKRHVTNSSDIDKLMGMIPFMNPKEPVEL